MAQPRGTDTGRQRNALKRPLPRTALEGVALSLLVTLGFLRVSQAGFVWDDIVIVSAIPTWDLRGIWFSPSATIPKEGHYWPILYTSFWLEHRLWGLNPAGFHIVNLLLHLVNTLLVWRLLARLAAPGAWLAAALFAVHPAHVEPVTWVIGRKDLLATLFCLSAALSWIRFSELQTAAPRRGRAGLWAYSMALALFVAAMLSKTVAVTLPLGLLIMHWYQQGQVKRRHILWLTPLFLAGFAIASADMYVYKTGEAFALGYTLVERVLIAAQALWFYVGKLLWPVGLAPIYPFWEFGAGDWRAWSYVLASAALPLLLWALRHHCGRGPLAAALFFAVTLSPTLGLIEHHHMAISFVADRYQYLASLGPVAVIAALIVTGINKLSGAFRVSALGGVALALITLTALTLRHSGIYRDQITFFEYALARNPQAPQAHQALSGALDVSGRYEASLRVARAGLLLTPDSAGLHYNAGIAHYRQGNLQAALRHLLQAAALDPQHYQANFNSGLFLMQAKQLERATAYFHKAGKIDPKRAEPHQNLAEIARLQGRYEDARGLYAKVLRLDPELASAHAGLAAVLLRSGEHEAALLSLERALALDPSLVVGPALAAERSKDDSGK